MSNRVMNRSDVPACTVAMRANAPVFSTEDRPHENRVAGHSEQPLYSPYSTTLDLHVPASDHLSYLRPPNLTGFGSCPTNHPAGANHRTSLSSRAGMLPLISNSKLPKDGSPYAECRQLKGQ